MSSVENVIPVGNLDALICDMDFDTLFNDGMDPTHTATFTEYVLDTFNTLVAMNADIIKKTDTTLTVSEDDIFDPDTVDFMADLFVDGPSATPSSEASEFPSEILSAEVPAKPNWLDELEEIDLEFPAELPAPTPVVQAPAPISEVKPRKRRRILKAVESSPATTAIHIDTLVSRGDKRLEFSPAQSTASVPKQRTISKNTPWDEDFAECTGAGKPWVEVLNERTGEFSPNEQIRNRVYTTITQAQNNLNVKIQTVVWGQIVSRNLQFKVLATAVPFPKRVKYNLLNPDDQIKLNRQTLAQYRQDVFGWNVRMIELMHLQLT